MEIQSLEVEVLEQKKFDIMIQKNKKKTKNTCLYPVPLLLDLASSDLTVF